MQLQALAGSNVDDNTAVNYCLMALIKGSEIIFSDINKVNLTIECYFTPQHNVILAEVGFGFLNTREGSCSHSWATQNLNKDLMWVSNVHGISVNRKYYLNCIKIFILMLSLLCCWLSVASPKICKVRTEDVAFETPFTTAFIFQCFTSFVMEYLL